MRSFTKLWTTVHATSRRCQTDARVVTNGGEEEEEEEEASEKKWQTEPGVVASGGKEEEAEEHFLANAELREKARSSGRLAGGGFRS